MEITKYLSVHQFLWSAFDTRLPQTMWAFYLHRVTPQLYPCFEPWQNNNSSLSPFDSDRAKMLHRAASIKTRITKYILLRIVDFTLLNDNIALWHYVTVASYMCYVWVFYRLYLWFWCSLISVEDFVIFCRWLVWYAIRTQISAMHSGIIPLSYLGIILSLSARPCQNTSHR